MRVWIALAVAVSSAVIVAATAHSGAAASGSLVVACSDITSGPSPAPGQEGVRSVLGVLALPTAYTPQSAMRVQSAGRWTYWMKAGVGVRLGQFTVTVTVAKAWRTRAAVSWGRGPIVSSIRFSGCAGTPLVFAWNAYVGGFYLRSPTACVPLVFSSRGRTATLRFGIGKRCP